jgi:hypothetical protein
MPLISGTLSRLLRLRSLRDLCGLGGVRETALDTLHSAVQPRQVPQGRNCAAGALAGSRGPEKRDKGRFVALKLLGQPIAPGRAEALGPGNGVRQVARQVAP